MTRSADPAPPLDPARRLCDIARIAELAELSRREGYRPGQVGGRLFSAADVLLVLDELAALRARLTQTEDADATIAALNEKVDALEWEIESGEPANRRKLLATVLARVTELEQQLTQTAQERDAFLAVRDAQPVYYAEALDLIADELRTLAPADFDARRWKILAVLTNAAHDRRRIQAELTQTAQARDQAIKERDALNSDIDKFWFHVEHGFDIEPRAYFEKEARKNGFDSPLMQAAHHMWKRTPRVEAIHQKLEAAEAIVQAQARQIQEVHQLPRYAVLQPADVAMRAVNLESDAVIDPTEDQWVRVSDLLRWLARSPAPTPAKAKVE